MLSVPLDNSQASAVMSSLTGVAARRSCSSRCRSTPAMRTALHAQPQLSSDYTAMKQSQVIAAVLMPVWASEGTNASGCRLLGILGEVRGVVLDQVFHLLAPQRLTREHKRDHRAGPQSREELVGGVAPQWERPRSGQRPPQDAIDDGVGVQRAVKNVLRLVIHRRQRRRTPCVGFGRLLLDAPLDVVRHRLHGCCGLPAGPREGCKPRRRRCK
mmetsp:Transcript_10474/g.31451  ORF Transcript_10474/g.31451 Transcript_10474/m.31451 type:complete len:214 (+) Transcript_10474:216-857(+)